MLGRDDLSSDTQVDVMTEEQLLRGLESMTPLEPSANIGSGTGPRERERDAIRAIVRAKDAMAGQPRDIAAFRITLMCSASSVTLAP